MSGNLRVSAMRTKALGARIAAVMTVTVMTVIGTALFTITQADSTLARKYEGTGLGLPLTRALIEMHGGRFEITSEEGLGTKASIRFPAHRTVGEDAEDGLSGAA